MKFTNSSLLQWFGLLILAVLWSIPLFGHLDTIPVRLWDESRLAMNAFEMYKNGNYLIPTFEGQPDMWNTKPPLMIWLQVLGMHIFGVNEWALRLPSAIAGLLTCMMILAFSIRIIKNIWIGVLASMILVTTEGYINIHITRTGDYDALLTFFATLACLSVFAYHMTKEAKYIYSFYIGITLAVLTKSISGMLFIPGLVLFIFWKKSWSTILRNRHFYGGLMIALITIVGYYLLREHYNPGYITTVQQNELGGRYLNVIEHHQEVFWFYLHTITEFQFAHWLVLFPCGLFLGLLHKDQRKRELTGFLGILIITYFLIISSARTKLDWYAAPILPFFAMISAICVSELFIWIKKWSYSANNKIHRTIQIVFLIILFILPYQYTIKRISNPHEFLEHEEFFDVGYYLKEALAGKRDLENQLLLTSGYNPQNIFYVNALQEKGINLQLADKNTLSTGDLVIIYQHDMKDFLESNYNLELVNSWKSISTYWILE